MVSDDILNSIVSDKIINDCRNGFILDGYPRTLDQSSYLNNLMDKQNLKLDYIFNIEIEFSILKIGLLKDLKKKKEMMIILRYLKQDTMNI